MLIMPPSAQMLMMRGLCGHRFTQRPADADDARPPSAQVYTDAG